VSPAVAGLVREWARGELARWRWVGVAAGLVTLVVLAVIKLARGPEADPPVTPPLAAQVTRAGPGTLLVVSQKDATVTFLDPVTGRTRATVATDPSPQEVAISPDGRTAAVANYGLPFGPAPGGTVTILDVAAGRKRKTVDVGAGSAPHGLVWLDDRRLLCTTENAEAVVEIDMTEGKVTRTLRTAQGGTHMVAAAGGRAYAANALSDTVTAFDLNTGVKLRDRAVGRWPEGIAISPDGTRLWVGNRTDNTVSVLAAEDLSVLKVLPAPGTPLRLAYSPDGKTVAVVQIESGELTLFDALAMTERKRVALSGGEFVFDAPGPRPPTTGVAFSPDGRTAYCAMHFSKAVAVVDVASGTVTGKFALPGDALVGVAFSPVSPIE
jgi:YVTN family beta-propeller protein